MFPLILYLHVHVCIPRSCCNRLRQLFPSPSLFSSSSTATVTLVHAFVVNKLAYGSSLYFGFPQDRLQTMEALGGVLRRPPV